MAAIPELAKDVDDVWKVDVKLVDITWPILPIPPIPKPLAVAVLPLANFIVSTRMIELMLIPPLV